MNLPDPASTNQPTLPVQLPQRIERFVYAGFRNVPAVCGLETLLGSQNRVVVIATELKENRGTSITNCVESLATQVCRRFGFPTTHTVWIEHYGYGAPGQQRTFDRVTFGKTIEFPLHVSTAEALGGHRVDTDDTIRTFFYQPHWRAMTDADWHELGLPARPPVSY